MEPKPAAEDRPTAAVSAGSRKRTLNRGIALTTGNCVFCEIIAGREQGEVLRQDDDVVVIRNILQWVPVMLLAMPRRHMTQAELWLDPVAARVCQAAAEVGAEHCPNGFRLLTNFGRDAMQSQEHGHLHILGGTFLGPYA